jgi:hypothetical protein
MKTIDQINAATTIKAVNNIVDATAAFDMSAKSRNRIMGAAGTRIAALEATTTRRKAASGAKKATTKKVTGEKKVVKKPAAKKVAKKTKELVAA